MKVSLMWECDTCDNLRAALYARRSTRCARTQTLLFGKLCRAIPLGYKDILSLKNDSRSPFSDVLFRRQDWQERERERERQTRSILFRWLYIARLYRTKLEGIIIFKNLVKFIILIYIMINEQMAYIYILVIDFLVLPTSHNICYRELIDI